MAQEKRATRCCTESCGAGNTIVAVLDEEGYYGTQGVNFIVPTTDALSARVLLALLNSSLVNWLFQTRFLNVAIKAEYLKDLPLPPLTTQQRKTLTALVDRILIAKRVDAAADTSALEREIDQQVYILYGLTPDEIRLVEESVPSPGRRAELVPNSPPFS